MFIVYYCVYKWNLLPSTAGLRCGTRPVLAVLGTFWSDAEYLEPLTRHEWEAGGGWLGKHGGKSRALERWSLGLVYCLDDLLGSGLLLLSLFRAWWMSCPVGFWTSLWSICWRFLLSPVTMGDVQFKGLHGLPPPVVETLEPPQAAVTHVSQTVSRQEIWCGLGGLDDMRITSLAGCPCISLAIEGPVWYSIYHHLPVVKGVNKPFY